MVGAACGVVAGFAALAIESRLHGIGFSDVFMVSTVTAPFGAMAGAIALPVAGWGLLRRVPIGRALAGTAIGTILGAIVGEVVSPLTAHGYVPGVIAGGFLGFVAAAIALRVHTSRTQSKSGDIAA